MRGSSTWNYDPYVEALGDSDWKAAACNRVDPEPVNRDELAPESAEIEVVRAHRRAVDDTQQNLSAGLNLDHLGVGERAVIGEEGIVFHVVQVGPWWLAALGHSGHPRLRRWHSAPFP